MVDRRSPPEERMPLILEKLKAAYPDATIALTYASPLECVISVILSAQSTDVMVNEVTKDLFAKYTRPEDYLSVPEEELQRDIYKTGFYRQKTKAIRGVCQMLIDEFDGQVPDNMVDLIKLPGVARKTANIILGNVYPDKALTDPDIGIAVDTHVGRVSVRLGLTEWDSKDAVKIEKDLMRLAPKEDWPKLSYLFIDHGRQICDAKRPLCEQCPVEELCPSSQEAGLPDLYRVRTKALKKKSTKKKAVAKKTVRKKTVAKKTVAKVAKKTVDGKTTSKHNKRGPSAN
jgi:endonuclease III